MTPSPPAQAEASETLIANIRTIIPHLRLAISAAEQGGAAKLAITSNFATGGKIIASFDTGFIEDVASLTAALQSERDSRDRRIAELEAALEPFAEQADNWDDVSQLNAHRVEPEFLGISVDQLRKARSALTPGEKS